MLPSKSTRFNVGVSFESAFPLVDQVGSELLDDDDVLICGTNLKGLQRVACCVYVSEPDAEESKRDAP